MNRDTWEAVERATRWLDSHHRPDDTEITMRLLKVTEEAGEAAQAWIGANGRNPRKGITHDREDVAAELADVVVSALVAINSLGLDPAAALAAKARALTTRLDGLEPDDRATGDRVTDDVSIRAGEPSDAAFVVEMARLASTLEDRPLPPVDDPGLAEGLPPSPDTSVVALGHDGRPVGAAWWHVGKPPLVTTPDGDPVPELVIAVTADARDHGVGRRLLDALATRAVEHGHDRLALNVHIRNPAARLYSRTGFVVAGRGRGPLGVAMVRDLTSPTPRQRAPHP